MHSYAKLIAIVLIVLGAVGIAKGMKDWKQSPKSCSETDMRMRDKQYLFMSGVVIVAGVMMLMMHDHGELKKKVDSFF